MFAGNMEKTYRDASGFKVMEKINKFKSQAKTETH
jgi:ring-1,2-phenylacetyl-CoA epoxidase subunit PaaB